MRKPKTKPTIRTKEQVFAERNRRHAHNGLRGSIAMAIAGMTRIMLSDSVTTPTRRLAVRISEDLQILYELAKVRVDHEQ